jgi:2,4-dienoyl-CoA reductase-like NADH-dependent reductase (Old Yellow Enzyme family)/thioredoxin reductase
MSGTPSFERLFQPIRLGTMEVKNRLALTPMATNFSSKDGFVTDKLKAYYTERARGGAGLVMVEESCVDAPVGKGGAFQLYIDDDKCLPGLTELAGAIHQNGAKAAIQLHHAGRFAATRYTGCQPVAPSAIAGMGGDLPRELSVPEIEAIVDRFAQSAERAKRAGFDGIEIQTCHGYLLTNFLSADSNKRQDAYGGPLTGRAKIVLDIVRAVKHRVGESYPVWVRLTMQEFHTDNGINMEEAKQLALWLEEAGIVALNLTADHYRANFGMAWQVPGEKLPRPPAAHSHAFMAPLAEEIKRVVNMPVMLVGCMNPDAGEQAISEGKIDMVVMARPLLADPEIPNKAASDRLDEIRPCIGCFKCREQFLVDKSVECSVNYSAGREYEDLILPVGTRKRVTVVGGGPAGLEAARVAASRGHEVVLFEKEGSLGGQLLAAAIPPYKGVLTELINYFKSQVDRLGIRVESGGEVSSEDILKTKPDAVVIAAGVMRSRPEIQGIEMPKVVDAVEVLSGRADAGDTVVVLGGGEVGCETAEFLADRGKKVTVVEMLDSLAAGMERTHKQFLLNRLNLRGVTMLVKTRGIEVRPEGLMVSDDAGEKVLVADTVVVAAGVKPNKHLYGELSGKVAEIYSVGDCVEPRSIHEAIAEGFQAACKI